MLDECWPNIVGTVLCAGHIQWHIGRDKQWSRATAISLAELSSHPNCLPNLQDKAEEFNREVSDLLSRSGDWENEEDRLSMRILAISLETYLNGTQYAE